MYTKTSLIFYLCHDTFPRHRRVCHSRADSGILEPKTFLDDSLDLSL